MTKETVRAPVTLMTDAMPGKKSPAPDPGALQTELLRFADEYAGQTTAVLDEYAARSTNPGARRRALQLKVSVSFAAVSIAVGPNPRANLVDFIALAMISRTALEAAVTTPDGAAFEEWLEVSRRLETNAWLLGEGVLSPEQQQELRGAIQHWWVANPDVNQGFFARPEEFSSLVRHTQATGEQRSGGVFSLVGLDPMAGLDPAVREVTSTRLFAERAMFMVQHMPFLVRWQTELLLAEMLDQPKVTDALDSADRLSRAAESVSQTAAQLPDRITAERKAVLEALETQESKLRALSAEVGRTLVAGEAMSTSLNTTLKTFDTLMQRFGVGEPDPDPADTNSPPFNILDYAQTAGQVAAMAQQLDTLIKDLDHTLDSPALDRRMAGVEALSQRARDDAKSVLNHAFLLAAGLLVLIVVGVLVIRRRSAQTPHSPSNPSQSEGGRKL